MTPVRQTAGQGPRHQSVDPAWLRERAGRPPKEPARSRLGAASSYFVKLKSAVRYVPSSNVMRNVRHWPAQLFDVFQTYV